MHPLWRLLRRDDLSDCFALYPPAAKDCGPYNAIEVWRDLLHWPGFNGVVVEERSTCGKPVTIGFGASLFISESFAQRELRARERGFRSRVLEAFVQRRTEIPDAASIGAINASDGLTTVVLVGRCAQGLPLQKNAEVQVRLATSFAELHAGYYFRRMLAELSDEQDRTFALASKVWRILPIKPPNARTRGGELAVIEKADVQGTVGTVLGPLFERREPILRLTPPIQRMLLLGLKGSPDPVISRVTGESVPQLKKMWAEAFASAEEAGIDLTGPADSNSAQRSGSGKRGQQKRHVLIDYLRQHLEELRPYAPEVKVKVISS